MRARLARWLFRVAHRLDSRAVGVEAVGIAPMYRAALLYDRQRHTHWVQGVEPIETRLP